MMGEFKKQIERNIRYMNATGKYGKGKEHAIKYFYELIEEAKKEFPMYFYEKTTIEELITFWEEQIKLLYASKADKRVLISWIQQSIERLKWFKKWFGE